MGGSTAFSTLSVLPLQTPPFIVLFRSLYCTVFVISKTIMYYSSLLCLVFLMPLIVVGQFPTDCPLLPAHNTTSIFDLRPNDIKVMMAVGDSITTGFGILGALNETRGRSFSMGGDAGAITLPNFF